MCVHRPARRQSVPRRPPQLEPLEDRTLLTVQAISLARPSPISDTASGSSFVNSISLFTSEGVSGISTVHPIPPSILQLIGKSI